MSSASKPSTLRLIVPKILAQRTVASLTPLGKAEAREITLNTGGLTTDNIVRLIKDYTKLRDQIGQTVRQIGLDRSPAPASPDPSNLKGWCSEVEAKAEEARSEYQKLQTSLDALDRQIQELDRRIVEVDQLKSTGFGVEELLSRATGFRRILGRVPIKKLDALQKALRASQRDTTVMTTGTRKGDSVYVLIATPTEDASKTLQTLLLYDFVQSEIPAFDESDPGKAIDASKTKKDELTAQRASLGSEIEALRKTSSAPLNQSADKIVETLLVLRGSLRLGEGSSTAHIFARLDRPPEPSVLSSIQRDGVLETD